MLILDECHRAKNLGKESAKRGPTATDVEEWRQRGQSKSAAFVAKLQDKLPLARVVYISATGASDPKHFCNLSRLGLWGAGTAFKTQIDFVNAMSKGGFGAMELVAMHMKTNGSYISRNLSFANAEFDIIEVELSQDFRDMYDSACEIWHRLIAHPEWWGKEMRLVWSAQQRFFGQMIMASKISEVVSLVKKSIADNMCCVIGLQSTGEAAASSEDSTSNTLFSNASNLILDLVTNYCIPEIEGVKEALINDIKILRLPPNPLDVRAENIKYDKAADGTSRE